MVYALTGWGGEEELFQALAPSAEAKHSQGGEAGVQDWISAFQTSVVSQGFSRHHSHWHQCTDADLHQLMNMRLGEQEDGVMVQKS